MKKPKKFLMIVWVHSTFLVPETCLPTNSWYLKKKDLKDNDIVWALKQNYDAILNGSMTNGKWTREEIAASMSLRMYSDEPPGLLWSTEPLKYNSNVF